MSWEEKLDFTSARSFARGIMVAAAACLAFAPAQAQDYPRKAVTLYVGGSPGGGGDLMARSLANGLQGVLGQPFTVINKPGASGNLATELLANAPADGYSLILAYTGHVINPALFKTLPFDPIADFKPVTMVAGSTLVLVVPKDSTAASQQDVIDLARANPGRLNTGILVGSSTHMALAEFVRASGMDVAMIPYQSNADALQDLLGGRLDFMFNTLQSSLPMLESGQLRALSVSSPERIPSMPDLPTVAESGVPGFSSVSWYGLLAPADTPDDIVSKLYDATKKALETPELTGLMEKTGNEVIAMPPAEFSRFIATEIQRYRTLADEIGLKRQ